MKARVSSSSMGNALHSIKVRVWITGCDQLALSLSFSQMPSAECDFEVISRLLLVIDSDPHFV